LALGTHEFYVHYTLPTVGMYWSAATPSGFINQKFTVNIICGSEILSTPKGAIDLNLINGGNQGHAINQKIDVSSYIISNYA
jgi:hypothetical protein